MYFVFTSWYIVLALLLVAIAAVIFFIVRMDKQDKVIIDEFANNVAVEPAESGDSNVNVEEKKE